MDVTLDTKINDLLRDYPYLLDYLVSLSPEFKRLKNPVLRKTMGRVATLRKAAAMGGLDPDEFVGKIQAEITRHGPAPAETPPSGPEGRQEALKQIIRDLHAGEDMEVLKARFREIVREVDAGEIAAMEQQLIAEGLPVDEVKRLCDVHVEIFKDALEGQDRPQPPPGHPVHTFMKENRASEKIISDLAILIGRLGRPPRPESWAEHRDELAALVDELFRVDLHYARKENQLFPLLEAHHFTGPSQVMWAIHDDIRGALKEARRHLAAGEADQAVDNIETATRAIRDMIYKEEHILYPTSLDMLSQDEWLQVKAGEPDIGYAWVKPDEGWPERIVAPGEGAPPAPEAGTGPEVEGELRLDTGRLSVAQVNLMLKHLPVDLTFVDAQDRVAYYSEGPERIFPRSPAVIGRQVRNCHPPKSVHLVNKILDAFKSGRRDTAAFWIPLGGRFIYIRYFAVRDEAGEYQGVLEVSQDLTELRKLEGQQRLLDWENE